MPDDTPTDRQHERANSETAREPLHELTLGRVRPSSSPPSPRPTSPAVPEHDGLEALSARCRAKAEAARWAAERQRRVHEWNGLPEETGPSDPAVAAWAEGLTDAFYWASAADPSSTPDVSSLDQVAGCFETVAEGLLLVRDVQERPGALERALPMLAEAQSALRQSLRKLKARDDPDQEEAYETVRAVAARSRIFLKRFLRADDLADPAGWPDLLARIEGQAGTSPRIQQHLMLLDRLLALCAQERTDATWPAILEVVEEWIDAGAPPSNRLVRELLLPLLDDFPDTEEATPGVRLVLRAIDDYLATRPPPESQPTPPGSTAEVQEAARLLSGRSVVLIGGLRRPEAQAALKSALGLKELVWLGTREHQSISGFEPAIARPDVALVLLAIRWSSHAFGEVKPFCDRLGKPLVRLPGGYGVNQVAAQILAQCGERFGDR